MKAINDIKALFTGGQASQPSDGLPPSAAAARQLAQSPSGADQLLKRVLEFTDRAERCSGPALTLYKDQLAAAQSAVHRMRCNDDVARAEKQLDDYEAASAEGVDALQAKIQAADKVLATAKAEAARRRDRAATLLQAVSAEDASALSEAERRAAQARGALAAAETATDDAAAQAAADDLADAEASLAQLKGNKTPSAAAHRAAAAAELAGVAQLELERAEAAVRTLHQVLSNRQLNRYRAAVDRSAVAYGNAAAEFVLSARRAGVTVTRGFDRIELVIFKEAHVPNLGPNASGCLGSGFIDWQVRNSTPTNWTAFSADLEQAVIAEEAERALVLKEGTRFADLALPSQQAAVEAHAAQKGLSLGAARRDLELNNVRVLSAGARAHQAGAERVA